MTVMIQTPRPDGEHVGIGPLVEQAVMVAVKLTAALTKQQSKRHVFIVSRKRPSRRGGVGRTLFIRPGGGGTAGGSMMIQSDGEGNNGGCILPENGF